MRLSLTKCNISVTRHHQSVLSMSTLSDKGELGADKPTDLVVVITTLCFSTPNQIRGRGQITRGRGHPPRCRRRSDYSNTCGNSHGKCSVQPMVSGVIFEKQKINHFEKCCKKKVNYFAMEIDNSSAAASYFPHEQTKHF